MKSSLKTDVFSVGKYALLNKLKKRHSTMYPEGIEGLEKPEYGIIDDLGQSESAHIPWKYIRPLGEACQSLLFRFFIKGTALKR